jgi:hypothetical protein
LAWLAFKSHEVDFGGGNSTKEFSLEVLAHLGIFTLSVFHLTVQKFKLSTNGSGETVFGSGYTQGTPDSLTSHFKSSGRGNQTLKVDDTDVFSCHIDVVNLDGVVTFFGGTTSFGLKTGNFSSLCILLESGLNSDSDNSS